MKRKTKRMTALFLSLIMVFSLVTGVGTVKANADVKVGDINVYDDGEQDHMPEDCNWPSFYTSATPSAKSYIYDRCREIHEDGDIWWDRYQTFPYRQDKVVYLIYTTSEGDPKFFDPNAEVTTELKTRTVGKGDDARVENYAESAGVWVEHWNDAGELESIEPFSKVYPDSTWEKQEDIIVDAGDPDNPDDNVVRKTWKLTVPGKYTEDVSVKAGFTHTYIPEKATKPVTEYGEAYVNLGSELTGLKARWSWDKGDNMFWKEQGGVWLGTGSRDIVLYDDNGLYTGKALLQIWEETEEEPYGASVPEEVNVVDGLVDYDINLNGRYVITTKDDAYGVSFDTCPKPVDFYNAYGSLSSRIPGDLRYLKGGEGHNIYIYANNDLEETIWNEEDKKDEVYKWTFDLDKTQCVGRIEEGSDEPVVLDISNEDHGWYVVNIPSVVTVDGEEKKYEHFEIVLKSVLKNGEKTGRTEEVRLNIDFIENNSTAYMPVAGFSEDFIERLVWCGSFPVATPASFKLYKQVYNVEKDDFDNVQVTGLDKSKLSIGYYDEKNEKWIDLEEKGDKERATATVSVKDDVITATFIREGSYDIMYDRVHYGILRPSQEGFAFYSVPTRPGFDEDILYLAEGEVVAKERQGAANPFYIHWWGWDELWQNNWNDAVAELPEAKRNDYAGPIDKDKVVDMLKRNMIVQEKKENSLCDLVSNFMMEKDYSSFNLEIKTASGKKVTGNDIKNYVTVTDVISKSGDTDFVVGKKLVVNKNVSEGFTVIASIDSNGVYVFDQLVDRDKEGNIYKDGELNFKKDVAESVGDNTIGILRQHDWTSNQHETIEYAVTYVPFTGIKITSTPTKVSYTEGDKLDVTGLAVAGVYADGITYPLTAADFTVSPAAALTTADKKATVTYKNLTASYDITVAAKQETPAPTPTPTPTPAPAEVGQNITSADPTVTGEFKVTDKADGTGNGAVTYEGEAEGSTAEKVVIPEKITAPDGKTYDVTEVADNALKGNTTVKEVVVSDKIIKIGANAFQGAKKLKKATLGKKVSKISANAFRDCANLKEVTFKNKGALTIGANVFKGDKKLKTITIKGKVKSVGKNAFKDVSKKCVINVKASKKEFKNVKKLIKKSGAKNLKIKRI